MKKKPIRRTLKPIKRRPVRRPPKKSELDQINEDIVKNLKKMKPNRPEEDGEVRMQSRGEWLVVDV